MPTLLCVDDEIAGLSVRKLFLESVGYTVLVAGEGEEALQVFSSHAIDAVILDYRMPGMDGGEVAARMRKIKPRVPIILYSAYLSLSAESLRYADAFVTKGQSPAVLLAEIKNILGAAHGHATCEGEYIAYADAQRRYIDVTDAFCRLLGYTREEMLGMSIDQVVASPGEVPERWQQYISKGELEGEIVLRHRSGALVPVAFEAKILPDGRMVSRMQPLPLAPSGTPQVSRLKRQV
jgi:PAS domain S-box-containing protein